MKKLTRHSVQWFYNLLEAGECDFLDFKEQLEDKLLFGRSFKNFASKYDELAKDVVAFANYKGGFIFFGIKDKTKEINEEFECEDEKVFELISQLQDRTEPTLTLIPHKLTVNNQTLLVLEIPFSDQIHRTSKGAYLIRSNDGNRAIEPHELSTILSEKGLIVYDQRLWKLNFSSKTKDHQGNPVPGWQDIEKTRRLYGLIKAEKPDSPYLKSSQKEFNETLGLIKEDHGQFHPTTTGILFIGDSRALKEMPFNQIKYVRHQADGSYTPYEFTGDLITMADQCFAQLKSEVNYQEFNFGLFRVFIEDFPEIVLRELLINALAHRDYSRNQIIEIRKYPDLIEFESPGRFPEGINKENYLRKTNPRNPSIMDIFREINYAEKARSGFDKIFQALLTNGKRLLDPEETENAIIFRVENETLSPRLIELSHDYKQLTGKEIDLESILVLNAILAGEKMTFKELSETPFINHYQLRQILNKLIDLELIEASGKTSGRKYHIHKSKLQNYEDERQYLKHKRQEKARQKEAILRYLNEFDEIDNETARKHLNIPDDQVYYVSRLLNEMVKEETIHKIERRGRKNFYGKGPR